MAWIRSNLLVGEVLIQVCRDSSVKISPWLRRVCLFVCLFVCFLFPGLGGPFKLMEDRKPAITSSDCIPLFASYSESSWYISENIECFDCCMYMVRIGSKTAYIFGTAHGINIIYSISMPGMSAKGFERWTSCGESCHMMSWHFDVLVSTRTWEVFEFHTHGRIHGSEKIFAYICSWYLFMDFMGEISR